jgi:hypothetical protein
VRGASKISPVKENDARADEICLNELAINEGRGVGILPANCTTCSASIADLRAHFDRLEANPTFVER